MEPFFSDKNSAFSKLILVENDVVLSNGKDVLSVLNNFSPNVASSFDIFQYEDPPVNVILFQNPVLKINAKFNNHPSIITIKDKNGNNVASNVFKIKNQKGSFKSGQLKKITRL